jgi:hypothetical protein
MRSAVIAVAMIALVAGAWLATRHTAETESVVSEEPPYATVDATARRENPSSPAFESVVEGDRAGADEVTYRLPKDWGPHGPMPRLYDEPEFRDALVRYLVASGLSATDSERSADAAIAGLNDCITSWGYADEPSLQACTSNVLQQSGLSETLHRIAITRAGSESSRRKAQEAAAAAADRAARRKLRESMPR